MFVGEYLFVDELLHLVDVYHRAPESVHGGILPVTQYTEKEMVRGDPVAAGPHRLFPCEIYYRAELVRYADFHIRNCFLLFLIAQIY